VRLESGGDRLLTVMGIEPEQRRQVEEIEELGALEQRLGLLLPGLAAVLRSEDLAELADDPAGLAVDELDVVEDGIGGGGLCPPRSPSMGLPRAPGWPPSEVETRIERSPTAQAFWASTASMLNR
jgi:hypothetical protein